MIPDPHFEKNLEKWLIRPDTAGVLKNAALLDAPPPGGINVVENTAAQIALVESTELVPYNPQLTYEVVGMFKQSDTTGSAGSVSLGVRFYAADRTFIEWHKAADMVDPGTDWTLLKGKYGAGTGVAAPANAQYMTVGALLNISAGDLPGDRVFQVTGLEIWGEPPPILPASGTAGFYGTVTKTYEYATLDSITVNVPGPGTLTLMLNANVQYDGCDASTSASRLCRADLYLCPEPSSRCDNAFADASHEDPDNIESENPGTTRTIISTVSVAAAGPRRFHINVYALASGILMHGNVTAFYTPGALTVTNP